MKPVGEIVRELIRRQVFRAAGAYVVVSWILVQVASIVFPEFDAPGWAMRALIVMLIVGFPFAMLIAWTIDVTGSGLVRTPDSNYSRRRGNVIRFGVVAIASLASAGVLWWVWGDFIEPSTQRPERTAIKSNPVIAVSAPVKLSGPEDIDWLGNGIANLLRNELAQSRHVLVISRSRWSSITGNVEETAQLVELAAEAGIDYLIGGEYLQTPAGIVLTSWIEDVENGNVIRGSNFDANDAAGVIGATNELALNIRRALNIPHEENVNQYAADFAVANMSAYEVYVAGLGFLSAFDYQEAEQSFLAALSIAPDFHIARFRLASVYEATGRATLAQQALASIPPDAEITDRERLYIEGARHHYAGARDPARAIDVYRELTERYPYDIEGGQLLADAYWLDFQEGQSIAVYRQLAELYPEDASSWMALGERLLDIGATAEADEAISRYAELSPDAPYAAALLGKLTQLTAQYETSIAHYRRSLELNPDFAVALLGLARSLYLEGDRDAAKSNYQLLIGKEDEASRFRVDAAFDLAGILRGEGRFGDANETLRSVEAAIREEVVYVPLMLTILARNAMDLGDPDSAAALIDEAIQTDDGPPTRHLFARALLELRTGDDTHFAATLDEIKSLSLPPDDPDRTEEKAVAWLRGVAALRRAELETAGSEFEAAMALEGHEYALYDLKRAEYLLRSGKAGLAERVAATVINRREVRNLPFELELERTSGLLLYARILAELQRAGDAREQVQQFLDRFTPVDNQHPDLVSARDLLSVL